MLTRRAALRLALGVPAISSTVPAWAFGSKEFWESKPSSEWNADEIERMITKSPWVKDASVTYNGGPGGFGGTGGGTGSSRGGIGFPGGGIGLPGGGGNRGGYPGGYPGGGGVGGPGGGPPRDDGRRQFSATVRWESALPIQEALRISASNEKPDPDLTKYYVIALIGDLPMVGGRRRRSGDSDNDDNSAQNDRRMEMYKQYTRLERKDGPVQLEKVEDGSRVGSKGPGTYFYFSRQDDISLDDKQISFSTKLGPMEIKAKFTLKDMLYHGKLAV